MLISRTHCISSGLKQSSISDACLRREPRVEETIGAGQRHRLGVDEAELELDADGWPFVAMEIDFGHETIDRSDLVRVSLAIDCGPTAYAI